MFRLFGIRHIRYLYARWRLYRWVDECAAMGLGLGEPNPSDLAYLDAIWRGEV
jgi:hypothetical protein